MGRMSAAHNYGGRKITQMPAYKPVVQNKPWPVKLSKKLGKQTMKSGLC